MSGADGWPVDTSLCRKKRMRREPAFVESSMMYVDEESRMPRG